MAGVSAPVDEPEPRSQFTDFKNSIVANNTDEDCRGNMLSDDVPPPEGTGDKREIFDEGPFSITSRGFNVNGDDTCGFDLWFGATSATIHRVTDTSVMCNEAETASDDAGTVTLTPNADGTVHVEVTLTGGTASTTYTPHLYNDCPTSVFSAPTATTNPSGDVTFSFDVPAGVLAERRGLGLSLEASSSDVLTTDLRGFGNPPLPPPKPAIFDLINTDPKVAPLADNGGPNQTHGLLPGSPALNLVQNAFCATSDQEAQPGENPPGGDDPVTEDQRHVTRPASDNPSCDAGAFEGTVPEPTPEPTPTPTPTPAQTSQPPPAAGVSPTVKKKRKCRSRRRFRIRLHLKKGVKAIKARVYVNNDPVKVLRGKRLTARSGSKGCRRAPSGSRSSSGPRMGAD